VAEPAREAGVSGSAGDGATGGGSGSGSEAGSGGGSGAGAGGAAGGSEGGSFDASVVDTSDGRAFDAGLDVASQDVVSNDGGDACVKTTFFFDGDGDGFGATTTAYACETPPGGHWVTAPGDCDDSNGAVHPAQENFFPEGYTRTGTTSVSFDYDCSGAETEAGNAPKAGCRLQNLTCVGAGYLAASSPRSGPGVNPFCGSASRVSCSLSGLNCVASAPQPAEPLACR
jgi:hypothetical protein